MIAISSDVPRETLVLLERAAYAAAQRAHDEIRACAWSDADHARRVYAASFDLWWELMLLLDAPQVVG